LWGFVKKRAKRVNCPAASTGPAIALSCKVISASRPLAIVDEYLTLQNENEITNINPIILVSCCFSLRSSFRWAIHTGNCRADDPPMSKPLTFLMEKAAIAQLFLIE
jgi:hypothetical protein